MVAYMLKEFLQVVTELFIAARKSNISLISLYSNILLFQKIYANLTHYLIMETLNLCEQLQKIIFNYSSDIDYYDFMRICRRTYFITNININHDN